MLGPGSATLSGSDRGSFLRSLPGVVANIIRLCCKYLTNRSCKGHTNYTNGGRSLVQTKLAGITEVAKRRPNEKYGKERTIPR